MSDRSKETSMGKSLPSIASGSLAGAARVLRAFALTTIASAAMLGVSAAGTAAAATPSGGFLLTSSAVPTNFSVADTAGCLAGVNSGSNPSPVFDQCDSYQVMVVNAGTQPTSQVTVADSLPSDVTIQRIQLYWSGLPQSDVAGVCNIATVTCNLPVPMQPNDRLLMIVDVTVNAGTPAGTLSNAATVSSTGVTTVSATSANPVEGSAPAFGVALLRNDITGLDGAAFTEAGGHPSGLTTQIMLNSSLQTSASTLTGKVTGPAGIEEPRDVVLDLPLGFMGSALAAPQCTLQQLSAGCPADTQVGFIQTSPNRVDNTTGIFSAIYNLVPERGHAAEFGYVDAVGGTHVMYAGVVTTSRGYVLQVSSPLIPQVPLTSILVQFYGNPAAADSSGNTPVAMFTNPSSCDGQPLTTTMWVDSWQHPGSYNADGTPNPSDPNWKSATATSPPVTGCNLLSFSPSISVQPETSVADSPSGLNVEISVPQSEDPNGLATPPLKDASVTLPAGFTVNPSSAAGLQACTSAQIALDSAAPPSCPAASQVGTVELQTPLIAGTLQGQIYLASQFDNPFQSLLAGYIVVDDPVTGVVIKIPGNLTPDPSTGQITGVFDNNPQFPFSDLKLHFKGGPTGVLATPESCGSFSTNSIFSPWSFPDSGPPAAPSDTFSIDSGCVGGFSPSLTAGSQSSQAGAYSPFAVSLSRQDTDENFSGLSVQLPPGMLAKLAGVQECSEQQLTSISSQPGTGANELANPSCPAGSQVGTVQTGAGVGPDPYYIGGKAYLTGPYKGAPYGLAVVVPAVAGPLDLGTVVVRQALYVDPTTAQVTDVSDPFPTILDGIPLRIRRVDLTTDRPGFTLNPTSCDPMSVTGTATSTQGTNAGLGSRFQVGGCQDLGFSPRLSISLTGRGRTRSGEHPNLTATLTDPSGQANIRQATVALPLSLALDPGNSQHVCNYDVALAVHGGAVGCPASTIVGTATAQTPLLDRPLSGPVYLVQGIRFGRQGQRIHTLPTLLIPLRGQIALDLRASSAVNGAQQLVTTFSTIPDAPVSKFTLSITGGPKGILVITGRGRSICAARQVAAARFGAQSGKTDALSPTLSTPCAAVTHIKKHAKRRRGKRHARDRSVASRRT